MRITFRAKLLLITAAALLALLASLGASQIARSRQTQQLVDVEQRLVPKLEVGPHLDSEFERLARAVQDAVAAQDLPALEATRERKLHLFTLIAGAGLALDQANAASLRWAIHEYHESALDVAQRMIAGESGETLVQDVQRMQTRQARADEQIKRATRLSRDELARAFAAVHASNRDAERLRFAIGSAGLLLVGLVSLWAGRSMLRVLGDLSSGFARFGTGDFSKDIPVSSADELSDAAREANQMAASLRAMAEQRARNDWLKAGQAGLSDQLRGALDLDEVTARLLSFLASRTDALAAALYLLEDDGFLHLQGQYAGDGKAGHEERAGTVKPRFAEGEGLVGEVFQSGELLIVDDPPTGYLKVVSGLGETQPRALVLLALTHQGKRLGVLELALLAPCDERIREFLLSVRTTLVLKLTAARSATEIRRLLEESQQLAERLTVQEEELRLNNQELIAQREELRRANEELEQQREALAQQNGELEQARARLQEKAEELGRVSSYKSQFLANMSHDLRTPLNSMLLLSHLLAENEGKNLTARQVEHAKTVHSAGQDLLALINQVLDLSKIEAGKQEVELETVLLAHFIDFARRTFEPLAQERGLELSLEIAPGMPQEIYTDRQRLERILTNLLGNAIKFTERGRVSLRIGRSNLRPQAGVPVATRAIAFSVSDTGLGIAEEARERVFGQFERAQVSGAERQGSGLGLAIARESARLLGGDVLLDSVPGQGSTFTCVLPERLPPGESPAARARSVPSALHDDRDLVADDEGFLLVIEDDPLIAEQLAEIIRARRLKVVVASTGREGLALAHSRVPLGIILDVKLPDIDGFAVMEDLKASPRTRNVPVHFISGFGSPDRALAMGAVGYLVKPATHAELAGVVRTLAPTKAGSQRVLVVEDDSLEAESIVSLLQNESFEAEHVRSAEAAVQALQRGNFGCIILDLGLPDMDGLRLLEMLHERADLGAPRVVVHTGRALTKQESRQLSAYAEAIVLKDGSSMQRLLEETRLFVSYAQDNVPKRPPAASSAPISGSESLNGRRFLVAEDDMRTIYALSALLRGKGAEVLVAENGRDALELLEGQPSVDAILMDVMMPVMDGYEATRRLREDPRFAGVPVIALTARAMKGERERCLEAGASDYLTKPIEGERLMSTLLSWIRRSSPDACR